MPSNTANETVEENLHVRDLILLPVVLLHLILFQLQSRLHVLVVVALHTQSHSTHPSTSRQFCNSSDSALIRLVGRQEEHPVHRR